MNALGTKSLTTHRVSSSALAVVALGGWLGFAYVSWSGNERALQSQIPRSVPERSGGSADRKEQGEELAPTRTVYPSPYGAGGSTPAQIIPSVAPPVVTTAISARPMSPVMEPATPERNPAHASSASPVPPQPSASSAQPTPTDSVTGGAPDSSRVDINAASVEELNRLGGRFGRAIIAGRPYTTTDELVSKRVLTRSTFNQIKEQITAN